MAILVKQLIEILQKYHQTMNQTLRSYWYIDNEIPIFKGEDREYIEKLIV